MDKIFKIELEEKTMIYNYYSEGHKLKGLIPAHVVLEKIFKDNGISFEKNLNGVVIRFTKKEYEKSKKQFLDTGYNWFFTDYILKRMEEKIRS